jgi:2-polyprenyl-3-methyl-5-hydroxy-6-metoxy-1,4-benzoquinol methylase
VNKLSDYEGHINLETAIKRKNFSNWVFDETASELKGDILEIGSGLGTYSKRIIENHPHSKIVLSDISEHYVKNLEKKFLSKNVSIHKLDLNKKEDFSNIGYEKFDSIIAINVLEHVEDDLLALNELNKMLKKDGTLIILVPANKFLYNIIDKSIGHWRRYTKNEISIKLSESNFLVDKIFSFNLLGIIGWYLNGNIFKKSEINKGASSLFDKLVPTMKILEKIFRKKIGLSIICYNKKI